MEATLGRAADLPHHRGNENSHSSPTEGKHQLCRRPRNYPGRPENGTRLHSIVEVIHSLSPLPDNIFLLVDSLPTQGARLAGKRGTVTGEQRVTFFRKAMGDLPAGVPINVILFPMEGDPMAASEYWRLATITGGSFMSPSRDWP